MQLFRCRVGGHFVLKNTGWFTLSTKRTLITGGAGSGKSTLLKALRSINPPFCHPVPAPFDAFPQYVTSGHHTRKVIPAKKTAVIAIFICSQALRTTLTQIDSVFLETEQIEVGRRLDNSRWITYVDIASSSRWSELAADMEKLRGLFPDTDNTGGLADLWRECHALVPTDRVKDGLADRLNALLDYLEERAQRQQDRELIHQARFLVNRQARFMQAREVTGESLPVFLYLHKDDLLSSAIDVERVAHTIRRSTESPCHCADLLFLELLGIKKTFLRRTSNEEIVCHLRENAPRYEEAVRKLNEQLMQYLKALCPALSLPAADGEISLKFDAGREKSSNQNDISLHHRWMLSCAVSVAYFQELKGQECILLLDEPDDNLEPGAKDELEAMLKELSKTCQMVVCATSRNFLGDEGRHYRLEQEAEDIPGSIINSIGKN